MDRSVAYDFTLPLDGAIRVRDYRQTLVLRSQTTLDGLQRISNLQFFPHVLSHIDLTPRINWEKCKLLNLLPDPWHGRVWDPAICQPLQANRALSCTIVCLSEYANAMRRACTQNWPVRGSPRHPFDRWKRNFDWTGLLKDLCITEERLRSTNIRRGDIVLFATGWREFAPPDGNLRHADWYPWHPYLMNPYLDERAVLYLLSEEKGIAATGLGCDHGTLDCPLRYVSYAKDAPLGLSSSPSEDWSSLLTEESICPASTLVGSNRFWATHIHVLRTPKKLLVEQLRIPSEVLQNISPGTNQLSETPLERIVAAKQIMGRVEAKTSTKIAGFPTVKGLLLLLPYQCSRPSDAVLTAAIFTPEEDSDA